MINLMIRRRYGVGLIFLIGALLLPPAMVWADGKSIYQKKGCVNCHGIEGREPARDDYPIISGQKRDYLVRQMKDIKSGARQNGQSVSMRSIMEFVSDQEITQIAEYLQSLD